MKNTIIVFLITLLFSSNINAQKSDEHGLIKWLTFEEAQKLSEKQPKPMFIDVYTDWCGWCTRMNQTTFSVPGIARYINQNYYPVRFDAETQDTIMFQGKEFVNKSTAKKSTHELAVKLLNGRLSYPTIVYVDVRKNISPVPGFMKAKDIEPILVYFGEDFPLGNVNYEEYSSYFMHTYSSVYKEELEKAKVIPDTTGSVKWFSPKEASELSIKNKKPIYFFFYTDWNQGSKIQNNINYRNPKIAKLLNENFYPVKVNAASPDSLILYGQTFQGSKNNQPHQLASALLQTNLKIPAEVFINHKKEKLNEMHGYIPPVRQESILQFFSKKAYLKGTYQDFMKTFVSEIKK